MQNKKETKKTAKKPANTGTKTKRLKGQTQQKKALPAAKSDKTPIARLMAAASRAALPGISLSSNDAAKPTKKTTATNNKTEAKGKASSAKSKAGAKGKQKATANSKAASGKKVKTAANGKAPTSKTTAAKKGAKTLQPSEEAAKGSVVTSKDEAKAAANGAGSKATTGAKTAATAKKAAANDKTKANGKAAANTKAEANGSAAAANDKAATGAKVEATEADKTTANGKSTANKAAAKKGAKAASGDAAATGDKATASSATVAQKDSKASKANKAAAKKNGKAPQAGKKATDKNASNKEGAAPSASDGKPAASSETTGSNKAPANGDKDAKSKAQESSKNKKKRYVPAHQAPPANKIEAIKQLPTTIRTKALLAKDWVVKNWRTPKFIAIVSVAVLYIVCSLVFSAFYLPGTTINGNDVSMRTAAAITSQAEQTSKNYTLTVSGDGTNFSVKGNEVDLSFDAESFGKEAKSRLSGWAWPIGLIMPRNFDVGNGVSFSEDKVKALVKTAVDGVNKNATLPQNATIAYDSDKRAFVAKDEKGGTALSNDTTWDSVSRGLHDLKDHVELGNTELQQPTVTANSTQMNEALAHANDLSKKELSLTVNGKSAKTVGGELIRQWLTIDDSYNIIADLDLVTDWAKTDLSSEIDTAGTARTYTRTNDGKRIEVYGGGTYGWNMDGAKLAEDVCDRIANSSFDPLEIPMKSKGEVYVHGKQDWGPRYVDVDLTEQYVRMFDEDSNIVMESACVSGNLAENNDTVTGVFALEKKESPATLVGLDENGDGQPDYENEVQYWMPFYGGYGLHDALWRSYFGEDVYQYDGSHGCINLPYWAAELLYSYIRVGDTVVVHF